MSFVLNFHTKQNMYTDREVYYTPQLHVCTAVGSKFYDKERLGYTALCEWCGSNPIARRKKTTAAFYYAENEVHVSWSCD